MASAYIASSNVNVFPSTRRTYAQEFSARLMTESAISRIVNNLIDVDGFVISNTAPSTAEDVFEFNVYGYYFQVKNILSVIEQLSGATKLYATIRINHTNDAFYELYVANETGDSPTFNGITFSNDGSTPSDTSTDIYKTLLLLEKSGDNWIIPQDSKIKFDTSAVGLTEIDGGRINWV